MPLWTGHEGERHLRASSFEMQVSQAKKSLEGSDSGTPERRLPSRLAGALRLVPVDGLVGDRQAMYRVAFYYSTGKYASPKADSKEAAQASSSSPCNRLGLPRVLGVPKNSKSLGRHQRSRPKLSPGRRAPITELKEGTDYLCYLLERLFIAPDLNCLLKRLFLGPFLEPVFPRLAAWGLEMAELNRCNYRGS